MRLMVEGLQPQASLAHFQPYLTEQFGVLRINNYPVSNHPARDIGLPPHIDDTMLTIVHQGCEVEGLELIKDGQWVSVPPRSNALVVLVAAVWQVHSNLLSHTDSFEGYPQIKHKTHSKKATSLKNFSKLRKMETCSAYYVLLHP